MRWSLHQVSCCRTRFRFSKEVRLSNLQVNIVCKLLGFHLYQFDKLLQLATASGIKDTENGLSEYDRLLSQEPWSSIEIDSDDLYYIVHAPTGCGKTLISIFLICLLRCRFLFLTDNKELVYQFGLSLKQFQHEHLASLVEHYVRFSSSDAEWFAQEASREDDKISCVMNTDALVADRSGKCLEHSMSVYNARPTRTDNKRDQRTEQIFLAEEDWTCIDTKDIIHGTVWKGVLADKYVSFVRITVHDTVEPICPFVDSCGAQINLQLKANTVAVFCANLVDAMGVYLSNDSNDGYDVEYQQIQLKDLTYETKSGLFSSYCALCSNPRAYKLLDPRTDTFTLWVADEIQTIAGTSRYKKLWSFLNDIFGVRPNIGLTARYCREEMGALTTIAEKYKHVVCPWQACETLPTTYIPVEIQHDPPAVGLDWCLKPFQAVVDELMRVVVAPTAVIVYDMGGSCRQQTPSSNNNIHEFVTFKNRVLTWMEQQTGTHWKDENGKPRYRNYDLLSGSTKTESRNKVYDAVRRNDDPVVHFVFATRILSMGIDLPKASVIVRLQPFGASRDNMAQTDGRAKRKHEFVMDGTRFEKKRSVFFSFFPKSRSRFQKFEIRDLQRGLGATEVEQEVRLLESEAEIQRFIQSGTHVTVRVQSHSNTNAGFFTLFFSDQHGLSTGFCRTCIRKGSAELETTDLKKKECIASLQLFANLYGVKKDL